jgi:hypothetical protein
MDIIGLGLKPVHAYYLECGLDYPRPLERGLVVAWSPLHAATNPTSQSSPVHSGRR